MYFVGIAVWEIGKIVFELIGIDYPNFVLKLIFIGIILQDYL